ncbi:DUF1707 SHOCT-like domain-containing protein [Micromonospora sp. H33]|uniref:DUF1707 SHOCT-like domain-containing protein n=1 Tax=Micromonospora sp. H33 TaxID=3452215 RepID=UPI003F8CE6E3
MQGRDGMRAADVDRQAVADRLRSAVDEGRLDLHEYDERLQQAYAARTYGELDALLADLPAPAGAAASALAVPDGSALAPTGGPTTPSWVPAVGARPVVARWLAEVWEPWLKVVPIVVAIWAVTSLMSRDALYFWPGWVAGPWGAVLLVRTVLGITSGEPARWADERERRRQRRREKRARRRERTAARRESRELPGESG